MSIYKGWKPIPNYSNTAAEPEAAPKAAESPPVHLRRAQPVEALLPRTAAWIASLPQEARPNALAARYARIANVLAATWDQARECQAYFEELLIDKRGGRQGFPPDVLSDLLRLRALHADLYPTVDGAWQSGGKRPR